MDLTLHADAVRESWRKMSANMSLTGSIESPDTNIRFNDVRGGYISLFPAKTFIRLDAFDIVGSLNETIKKSLK